MKVCCQEVEGSTYGKEQRMAILEIPKFVLMGSKFWMGKSESVGIKGKDHKYRRGVIPKTGWRRGGLRAHTCGQCQLPQTEFVEACVLSFYLLDYETINFLNIHFKYCFYYYLRCIYAVTYTDVLDLGNWTLSCLNFFFFLIFSIL